MEELADTVVTGTYRLPAVITVPAGSGSVPMVVLVHGSGALDKDETVMENRPFRDLALGLAVCGIATLRYDKRTFAYSESRKGITIDGETTDDALSAVSLARAFGRTDSSRVFVLGHSLGGMMAPRIASRASGVCGIIIMAGPARSMEELLDEQMRYMCPSGASEAFIDSMTIRTKALSPQYFSGDITGYDQLKTAAELGCPVLVLQGERDYQVRMTDFNLWKSALGDSGKAVFRSYPALNHLFMEGKGGMSTPMEYAVKGRVPQYVIADIAEFVIR